MSATGLVPESQLHIKNQFVVLCSRENIPEQKHLLISSPTILFTNRTSTQHVQPIYLRVRGRVSLSLQTPFLEIPLTT